MSYEDSKVGWMKFYGIYVYVCVCVGLKKKQIKMKKEDNVKKIPQYSQPPFQWQYLSLCPVPT